MRSWNLDNFPNFRGKIKKSLSCHHLEIGIPSDAQNLRNSQSCLNMAILISMLDFWGVSLSWRKHLFFPPKKNSPRNFSAKKNPTTPNDTVTATWPTRPTRPDPLQSLHNHRSRCGHNEPTTPLQQYPGIPLPHPPGGDETPQLNGPSTRLAEKWLHKKHAGCFY